jgi:hypothetical protein
MELNKTKWGFIFAVFSALFWGTASTFIKVLTDLGLKDITLVAMQPTVLAIFFLCRLLVSQPKFLLINWSMLLSEPFNPREAKRFSHLSVKTKTSPFCLFLVISVIKVWLSF